ncbi:hypothetical protein DE146DRAFT_602017 [Phaeosphaeria sp. MPI-PUGE-AT-0046c]|nr:hypothetical protein DE146DRAFT_602017 [Phaeosphaeria sp. MPI-PUGE-AT-0046c]
MAHHHRAHRSSSSIEGELWFSMPSSTRRQQESSRASEQSAYRATSHRRRADSNSPPSSKNTAGVPSIYTMDTNKPLPPSPTDGDRKKHKPAYLRSLLGRTPSGQLDPNRLQAQPYHSSQRHSTASTNLSVDTHSSYHHGYSRSMPSSPYDSDQGASSHQPGVLPRAHSAAANYQDLSNYQPYTPPSQYSSDTTYFARLPRASSLNACPETTPPRARTFPVEETIATSAMREGVTNRPRPHTWLSPTESFSDASQFSLFVQATTGLPEDSDPFSPTGRPQLQGSLFARRSGNDTIPIPAHNYQTVSPRTTDFRTDWQNYEPPTISHRSTSGPSTRQSPPRASQQYREETPHMAALNWELELLGLEDGTGPEDELPDYAQSQAEANAKRRAEASARARELETRWRNTRH